MMRCYAGGKEQAMSRLMIVEVPSYTSEFKGIREVCELVRCGECRWLDKGENESCSWSMCTRHIGQYINVSADDFCSYGERKSE